MEKFISVFDLMVLSHRMLIVQIKVWTVFRLFILKDPLPHCTPTMIYISKGVFE